MFKSGKNWHIWTSGKITSLYYFRMSCKNWIKNRVIGKEHKNFLYWLWKAVFQRTKLKRNSADWRKPDWIGKLFIFCIIKSSYDIKWYDSNIIWIIPVFKQLGVINRCKFYVTLLDEANSKPFRIGNKKQIFSKII